MIDSQALVLTNRTPGAEDCSRWSVRASSSALGIVAAAALACTYVPSRQVDLPPAEHPDSAEHRRVQSGHELYHSLCASCHGVKGEGNGPMASELRQPPADLTLIAKRRAGVFPEHDIHEIIDGRRELRSHGSTDMPVWGRYFRREVSAPPDEIVIRSQIMSIVEYLKTIQK